jgi:hypothetical protein
MDVTDQVQLIHLKYGGSDDTNPASLSSSKKLNYAAGSSISKPDNQRVAVIPFTLKYEDSVGLFGSENHYIKVAVDVDFRLSNVDKGVSEGDYLPAALITEATGTVNDYATAVLDYGADQSSPVNDYYSAEITYGITPLPDGFLSIELTNTGTGNKYIDSWFDVRLYTREREEHPFDVMYIRPKDYFYIGFHARDTKRLPYKVSCLVGSKLLDRTQIEQRYIARASRELHYTSQVDVPVII